MSAKEPQAYIEIVNPLPEGNEVIGRVEIEGTSYGLVLPVKAVGQQQKLMHPFGMGVLTLTGAQYGAEHTTSTDGYEMVELITFEHLANGTLEELEFGLTMAVKSSGAAEDVNWKWEIRDLGGDWEALIAEQTVSADASAYADVTCSGRFKPTGNFPGTGASFEVRAWVKSASAAGETASGKVKNSSYILATYKVA